MKRWKGEITFTRKENKKMFSVLSWLAKAASRDETRWFMTGIFNEVVEGNRIFVATDGRRLHKIELPEKPDIFKGLPTGKNLTFKADSKQITFTIEIDGAFPDYKKVIPDITDITPFDIHVCKELAYTEALYELYSRKIRMNAAHIAGIDMPGSAYWRVYHHLAQQIVVLTQIVDSTEYTLVSALLRQ